MKYEYCFHLTNGKRISITMNEPLDLNELSKERWLNLVKDEESVCVNIAQIVYFEVNASE